MTTVSPISFYTVRDSDLILDSECNREKDYVLKIRDLPSADKPREKLISDGPESLALRELVAIVLGTGTSKEGVLEMAGRIVKEYGEHGIVAETDPGKLSRDLDIPIVKACQIGRAHV